MARYNTGQMPGSDATYEDFEELLASFYVRLRCLEESLVEDDRNDYESAIGVLNDLAVRYNVQLPQAAADNLRVSEPTYIDDVTTKSTLEMLDYFSEDFGIASELGEDHKAVFTLQRIVLSVFERYGVVSISHFDGKLVECPYRGEVLAEYVSINDGCREKSLEDVCS